jgi:hypothetical protein
MDDLEVGIVQSNRGACGWSSSWGQLLGTPEITVATRLEEFVSDPNRAQKDAWRQSLKILRSVLTSLVAFIPGAAGFSLILEYEIPRESRRADAVLIGNGVVIVVEFKGFYAARLADLDQVSAYARDLRGYHAHCADRPVHAVLVPTSLRGPEETIDGVVVAGPESLGAVVRRLVDNQTLSPLETSDFLDAQAYAPLPSLVRAARELFSKRPLPRIRRARAATDPALACIQEIAQDAASRKKRKLVLLTGVPGAGKTLVGLRLAHDSSLDDLTVERAAGLPAPPTVFLSGNGPLVQVLQNALRDAGGEGKTFVRGVKDYVRHYTARRSAVPPEHILIFDEAQRAWDQAQMREKHEAKGSREEIRSEPEHFIEFAERIPEWCVVVGLIGTGQEIHRGEEGGLGLWRTAIERSANRQMWEVHASLESLELFKGSPVRTKAEPALNLNESIRYHLAPGVHSFVGKLLEDSPNEELQRLSATLHHGGHCFRITRDRDKAEAYARDRLGRNREARYGWIASSKSRVLPDYGLDNSFQATKRLKVGDWYNQEPEHPLSCCQLKAVATEFAAQGLELDLALLGWEPDLRRQDNDWILGTSILSQGHPSISRCCDIDSRRDHQLCQFEESML